MLRRILPLICLALPLAGLLGPARAAQPQVWVLVQVIENKSDHEQVNVRFPIQAVREMDSIVTCDKDGKSDSKEARIRGRELYERYKDLPLGEERLVETAECDGAKVSVRVSSEEALVGNPARRIRILISDKGEKNLDLGFSLDTLDDFGAFLGFLGRDLDKERIEDFDEDKAIDLLKSLPPFELVRILGSDNEKVIIRTE